MNLTNALPNPVTKPKVHFQFIDALRGIGALWVVLFHSNSGERLTQLTNLLGRSCSQQDLLSVPDYPSQASSISSQ
jgi:hypothetical protein